MKAVKSKIHGMITLAGIKLKHVERFRDRHSKTRYYFRQGKGKRVALQGLPGTDAFNHSYALASKSYDANANTNARTFNTLAKLYFASSKFKQQKRSTQKLTRGVIERFTQEHGHRLVSDMDARHIDKLFAEKAHTPGAANLFLAKLKVLLKFARSPKLRWIKDDLTLDIQRFKIGTHHTWTEEEIAQYEKRWPLGTVQRMAFDLSLYTGQRNCDSCRMEWADIINNKIRVTQQKGGKKLIIPTHRNLQTALVSWPHTGATIVATKKGPSKGSGYSAKSYGDLIKAAALAAGLPNHCVAHGLRKAAGRRLAEAGCTPHQIAAILGHTSLREVERYTVAANQERLADQAMAAMAQEKYWDAEKESLGKAEIS